MHMAIDINADLGECIGDDPAALDAKMLAVVSSANVACGGHAGDDESMRRVCETAAANHVAIGAHVSYVDRKSFGRTNHAVSRDVLHEQLLSQMLRLDRIAVAAGSAVTYVKPHGALYHQTNNNPEDAGVITDAVLDFTVETGRHLAVLGLPDSELLRQTLEAGLTPIGEAFADRAYTPEGRLVPRTEEGALITDPREAIARLRRLVRDNVIIAIDGTPIEVHARSICLHGDTPNAAVIARRLRGAIDSDRVRVAPFAPPPTLTRRWRGEQ